MRCVHCLLLVALLLSGCSLGASGVRRGTSITTVQFDFGQPDAISDCSGDLARFYVPTDRPEDEWPWDAPRAFYYLDRNLAVIFVRGKAVRADPIDDETREQTLEPLIQRHHAAEHPANATRQPGG